MGRLFWKIFLWFWLAMILTTFGITWVMMQFLLSSDEQFTGKLSHRMEPHISAVSSVLKQSKDDSSLRAILKDLSASSPFRIFIIDDQGQELLGRSLPKSFNTETTPDNHSDFIEKREIISATGDHYTLLIKTPGKFSPTGRLRRSAPFQSFRPFARNPRLLILRLGLAILLSGAVCFWLAWYLARPVRQLREASLKLAEGDLDVRVAQLIGNRRDEIADLGRDFDYMAERLQLMMSRQKQLIQDVSHELRSPLARLQIALGLTRKKSHGHPDQNIDQELDRIEREANRLESLIAQVLMLARLEESNVNKLDEYIDIAELLESILDDADYETANRNCDIHLDCRIHPIIKANGELLHRALENIIRNALKYTPDGTTVNVELQNHDKHAESFLISVCDHGPGVPEEQLPKLFEPFFRVAESRDRNSGGYGLGLAIAKRAIQFHNGHITAHNGEENGLCVEVSLPLHNNLLSS